MNNSEEKKVDSANSNSDQVSQPKEPRRKSVFDAIKGGLSNLISKQPSKKAEESKKASDVRRGTTLYREGDFNLKNFVNQENPAADAKKNDSEQFTKDMKELLDTIERISEKKRFDKAVRHFHDALYSRPPRNDLDQESCTLFLKFIFHFQTHPVWDNILFTMTCAFLVLTIFEPAHRYQVTDIDKFSTYHPYTLASEIIIISLYWLDIILFSYHQMHDKSRPLVHHFLKNKRFLMKIIFNIFFVVDASIFYSNYPTAPFRFSRMFRPVGFFLYNRGLRRTFEGVLDCFFQILELVIFFLLLAMLWGLIGMRLIEGVDGSDFYQSNFTDFPETLNGLYLAIFVEGYPNIMIPSLESSFAYVFYFIPYITFGILMAIPIPNAVLFDAFRVNRSKKIIADRLLEREALFACFVTLDTNKTMEISKDEFMALLLAAFRGPGAKERIEEIYAILDFDGNGCVELEEFFRVPEILINNKNFWILRGFHPPPWEWFKAKFNKYLRLRDIVTSDLFEFMTVVFVVANTVVLVIYINAQTELQDKLEIADKIFVYVFGAEVVLKWVGLGIKEYFSDNWNVLDFLLTIASLVAGVAFSIGRFASKVLRQTKFDKSERVIKMSSYIASTKFFQILKKTGIVAVVGFLVLCVTRVKKFIQKIMIILPTVFKLVFIMFIALYSWSVIGMEFYHEDFVVDDDPPKDYLEVRYADFNSIGGAMLLMFQIQSQQVWSDIFYDCCVRFGMTFVQNALYFDSFHTVNNLVLLSIVQGMIWEVFSIIDKNMQEQEKLEQMTQDVQHEKTLAKMKHLHHTHTVSLAETQNHLKGLIITEKIRLRPRPRSIDPKKRYSFGEDQISKFLERNPKYSAAKTFLELKECSETLLQKQKMIQTKKMENEGSDSQDVYQRMLMKGLFRKKTGSDESTLSNQISRESLVDEKAEDSAVGLKKNQQEAGDLRITQIELSSSYGQKGIAAANKKGNKNVSDAQKRYIMDVIAEESGNTEKDDNIDGFGNSLGRSLNNLDLRSIEMIENHRKLSGANKDSKHGQLQKKLFYSNTTDLIEQTRGFLERHGQGPELDAFFEEEKQGRELSEREKRFYVKRVEVYDPGHRNDLISVISPYRQLKPEEIEDQDWDLKKKRQDILKSNMDDNTLLRKALLMNANMKHVEKYEEDFFTNLYGDFYSQFKNNKISASLFPLHDLENRITVQLTRIVRSPKLDPENFVETLLTIENSISNKLMQTGGFTKMLFQSESKKWFCLTQNKSTHKFEYCFVGSGPWNHFEDIFKSKNKLYVGKNILHDANKEKLTLLVRRLKESFLTSASCLAQDKFSKTDKSSVWNLFAIPIEHEGSNKMAAHLFKLFSKQSNINLVKLYAHGIRKCIVISLALSRSSQLAARLQKSNTIAGEGSEHDSTKKDSSSNMKKIHTSFFEKEETDIYTNLNKQKKDDEEDEEANFLPLNEFTEFLNDVRDALHLHRATFLTTVSEFYVKKKLELQENSHREHH